jgi:hypothetical protein
MKFAITTAALLLVLGTTASVYAGQDKGKEEDKPQAEHSKEAKPAEKQAKPAEEAKPAQEQHQAKAAEQKHEAKPAEQQQAHSVKPAQTQHTQHAASTQQSQPHAVNHTEQTKSQAHVQQTHAADRNGGGSHGRISDDHYRSNFGSEHRFHVNRGEYESHRFEYGGYSFGFIDPWPVEWGYDDDVYVVYADGGYYMYDRVHPGLRISINIL